MATLLQIIHNRAAVSVVKSSALKPEVELQPHQKRVVERIKHEPSVLVYHGLGSGKTLASIAAGEGVKGQKEVLVPASLRENYRKELGKFTRGKANDYNIKSYTRAAAEGGTVPAGLTIFDEAHRAGREGTAVSKLPAQVAGKTVFLTGTPVRNEPAELVPLLKALARDRKPPGSAKAFKEQFIGERKISPGFFRELMGVKPGSEQFIRNEPALRRLLQGRVDYHPSSGQFPGTSEKIVEVEMAPQQARIYEGLMSANPALAYKVRRNLPPSKTESKRLNSFLGAVRQVSNSPQSYDITLEGAAVKHSPKMQRMVIDLMTGVKKDPNFKALVYSNYLESGVEPLALELQRRGLSVGLFTGKSNDKERAELVSRYNRGDIKVLLVSGAGSEGLDLKGTKMVQLMEPHWNKARLDQVVGRAVRHQSHARLPLNEQKVQIRHYFSKPPKTWFNRQGFTTPDMGADRYLEQLSIKKDELIQQLLRVLQRSSAEKAEWESNKQASLIQVIQKRAR